MQIFSPASPRDAIDLIQTYQPTLDTTGAQALFATPSLQRLFDRGHRAPDRVWALRTDDPDTRGLVAARLMGNMALVDMLALPSDDDAATSLLETATRWARAAPEAELSFESPAAEQPFADAATARVLDLAGGCGWRMLVTRRHYELPADAVAEVAATVPLSVNLEQATDGDHERLVDLLQRVLPGSLDVRDQESVSTHGLRGAAGRLADELLAADPVECIRFAVVDAQGGGSRDAAMVSWRAMPHGRGYVLQVGVALGHRGRGLGGELVAAATRDLVASGATTLVGDTDDGNVPMIRGFARAGWQATAARVDLTLS